MKKVKVTMLFIVIFFTLISTGYANNDEDDFISKEPMDVEEIYEKMGYTKDITKTINHFEKQFSTKVIIPKKMPFKVNLSFAKMEDDNTLSLDFIGEDKKDIFKITVNPNEPFNNRVNYKLNDGNKIFIEKKGHDTNIRQLYMKKDDFEYVLGISNFKKYKKQELVKLAEFISNN